MKKEAIIQTLTEFFCADLIEMDTPAFTWGEQTKTVIDVNGIRVKIEWVISEEEIPEEVYEKKLEEFRYHIIDISRGNLEPIMYHKRRNGEETVIEIYITIGYKTIE